MRPCDHRRAAALLSLLGALCLAASGERPALAGDFQLKSALSLSEEYDDNVFQTATGERSDFVTRVSPSARASYRTPVLGAEFAYAFDYRNYARGNRGDEKIHTASADGSATLLDNFLFLDLSDALSRVSLDVARDVTSESVFLNQTDKNRACVSPYLQWRLGQKSQLRTGYRYSDIRYWTVSGSPPGIDKIEHRVFAALSHDPVARLSISAGYGFSRFDTEIIDYRQHDVSAGIKYQYADNSSLFGGVGNNWQLFSGSRGSSNLFWNAGISHDFGPVVATLETKVQYTEDPLAVSTKETTHSARVEKVLEQRSFGLAGGRSEYAATVARANGTPELRKTYVTGFWRQQISPRLGAHLTLVGDKVTGPTLNGYPYHLSGSVGLRYGFNYDISATLAYTYVDYRRQLDSAADARQANRLLVELRKAFTP